MMQRIICGDAIEELRKLPDASVDMVFTDPPYGHNNNNNGDLISRWEAALGVGDYQPGRDDRPINNDGPEANDLFRAVLPELNRLLRTGGCCCCCCCGGGPDPQFARWSLWLDEVFDFKQMVVWDKGPMGMGWHYRRSYETVLVGTKPGGPCKWYDTTKRVENIIRPKTLGIRKLIPSATDHPTPKPVSLAAHFINLHTAPGDIVLDPFCGAGSTLMAAAMMDRGFIGIEIDKKWADKARQNLETDMPLFAEAGR